jgi:hypothetical protein
MPEKKPLALAPEESMQLELEKSEPGQRSVAPAPPLQAAASMVGMTLKKQPLHVRVCFSDGARTEGEVFLSEETDAMPAHAMLNWLVELGDGFFPLRESDGRTAIVHTSAVRWMAAQRGDEPMLAARRNVRVDLEGGERLEGVVSLDVPTTSPRVSDLFNEPRPYVPLDVGSEQYALNRRTILRVYDLGTD